ncbi:unnamed protein product [Brassica oleracea]
MEAIDLNDDGQNDVMDEDIEDHEVLEDPEAHNRDKFSPAVKSQGAGESLLYLEEGCLMVQLRSDATFVEGFTS